MVYKLFKLFEKVYFCASAKFIRSSGLLLQGRQALDGIGSVEDTKNTDNNWG